MSNLMVPIVKIAAVATAAGIAYSAAYRGNIFGEVGANDQISGFDTDILMRQANSCGNLDPLLDPLADHINGMVFMDDGPLCSLQRGFGRTVGVVKQIAQSAVPIGVALGAFGLAAIGGSVGAVAGGVLVCGLLAWGAFEALKDSGVIRNGDPNLD